MWDAQEDKMEEDYAWRYRLCFLDVDALVYISEKAYIIFYYIIYNI